MNHLKWFSTDHGIKICDVVLFLKQNWEVSNGYQYDMVNVIVLRKDGIIRKAIVQYRNHRENVDQNTTRSARDLVLIHPIDELNLMDELRKVASIASKEYEELNI